MAQIGELLTQIAQVRAQHHSMTASQGAPIQLPGLFGTFLSGITQAASVMAQAQLDLVVQPLESEKQRLEEEVAEIDSAVLRLERHVSDNS